MVPGGLGRAVPDSDDFLVDTGDVGPSEGFLETGGEAPSDCFLAGGTGRAVMENGQSKNDV